MSKRWFWVAKDIIKCFMCAVRGIERTFNTYDDLQDHIYKDHDVHKDPAMEAFNKYKDSGSSTSTTPPR